LHIGQHLVIRELLRAGVLNSEVAKSMAFAPRYSVRKLLNEMGYSQFNEDSKSNDIYELLKRELKCSKKATFNGAYDIPLQLLATDENARSDFNKWAKKNSFEQIK
jgi:hypothetical protein